MTDPLARIPYVEGVLSREQVAETAAAIVAMQEASGAIPWTTGQHADIWNHVEAAMAMLVGGQVEAAERGETVVGYGAPGKGNTLLNHCGIRPDLLAYTVDRNPYKHGRFTPGTRIPILPPEQIAADKPDYVLVLPWNLRAELVEQLSFVHDWGGRLVFPIPELSIVEVKA